MYNYVEAVKEDFKDFIKERYELESLEDIEDLNEDEIADEAFFSDSVTGNASGSYTFNRWKAQEYVLANLDLLNECVENDEVSPERIGVWFLEDNFEAMDVIIRCYILYSVVSDAISEIATELE